MQRPWPKLRSEQYFICKISGEMYRYIMHQHDCWKPTETSVKELINVESTCNTFFS